MSRRTPARPEQTQSLSDIIRDALRAAALAPDTASALDVAGAALCDIAQLTRCHQLTQPDRFDNRPLRTVERAMDNTEGVLERAACIFEAIDRLTRDGDDVVNELALIGRSIVAQQSEAVDSALMTLHRFMAATEACHG